jgi:hypothetical protein
VFISKWSKEFIGPKELPKQFRHRHVRRVYACRGGMRLFEVLIAYDVMHAQWQVNILNDRLTLIAMQPADSLEEAKQFGDEVLSCPS